MIHIHNGDVVAALARRADLPGEHLSLRESLVTGPVQPGPRWIELRAHHLAAAYNEDVLRASNDLFVQDQALDAATKHDEIVLWFEHDLFCLIHLVHLLQRFGERRMSLVWHRTPLAELDERELHLRFESRGAVTPAMIATAREVWRAYTSSDPTALNRWIESDTPDFPFLREGLTLHARRFPSTRNGLGVLEQRALELIAAGVADFASLFPRLDGDPPRYGFGDAQMLLELRALANRQVPLIAMTESEEGPPAKAFFTIMPAGENVLRGEVDDATINDRDLWLGGAHLTKETMWRWDDARRQIIPSPSAGS